MFLMGYYTVSYSELVKVFGQPDEDSMCVGYKISTRWELKTDGGKFFELYDYKKTNLYNEGLPSVEKFRKKLSYTWHISCLYESDLESIKLYLDKKLKSNFEKNIRKYSTKLFGSCL